MIDRLLTFLDASPVNFLAVKNIVDKLEDAGFKCIDPTLPIGNIKPGEIGRAHV